MRNPTRTPSQESLDLQPDVHVLTDCVKKAWAKCTFEYFQLMPMKLVDEQYTLDYLNPTLHDAIIFRNFFDDLNSSDFRNRQVWQAWHYIRPLVVKYLDSNDQITHLDHRASTSIVFFFSRWLGGNRRARSKRDKPPDRKVTPDEWENVPAGPLNQLLNQAAEICGYQQEQRIWEYKDVFPDDSHRILHREPLAY